MNVLFLTLVSFSSLKERNIYSDLLREFVRNGHKIFVISPVEKRYCEKTHVVYEDNARILRLRIGNTQKTNIIEKGISTVMIEPSYKAAIKNYFSDIRFDLVLYSTPPITLVSAIEYVKKRDGAESYLLLKDIYPQNAVDIGLLNKHGIKGVLYKYFRRKEKRLYAISDRIGCMSPANVRYVIEHNPEINPKRVEECPNSIEVIDKSVNKEARDIIRTRYGIPLNKMVYVYGGNLGKPQGIPFLIQCLRMCADIEDVFFLIVGDGTEFWRLQTYVESSKQTNLKLMKHLPKEDYDTLVGACDVGLIFLDHRFTIPNFPSRILAYMQAKLPVLAVTDPFTDVRRAIEEGDFGWWCESNSVDAFVEKVKSIMNQDCKTKGQKSWAYINRMFSVSDAYKVFINKRVHLGDTDERDN